MNIVVSYPGRFQPFCRHHARAYQFLCSLFGKDNVYVISTGIVESDTSPLTFDEKRELIERYVPSNRIVQVKNPYKAEELLSRFDLTQTISLFAYSYKDSGRISFGRKIDGSPRYFKPFTTLQDCEPASECGYILVLPQYRIQINGKELSGTYARRIIQTVISKDPQSQNSIALFRKIMGWYDRSLYNKIIGKF